MPRDRNKPVRRLTDDQELFFADGSMLVARRLYADGVSHMETADEVLARLFPGGLDELRALYAERSDEIERLPRMAWGPGTRSYGYWVTEWFPPDRAEEVYHDIAEQRRWLAKGGLIDEQEQAAIDREQQQAKAQRDFGRKKKG